MKDTLTQALQNLNSRLGESVFSDNDKFNGAIADILGDMKLSKGETQRVRVLLTTAIAKLSVHLCLLVLICAALFFSVSIPLERKLEAGNPAIYERITNRENAVRHTLTEDSNLYMLTSFTRQGVFRSSTERFHFPGAVFVPRIPVQRLPVGTEFTTAGATSQGLLHIAVNERIVGHVPAGNTTWTRAP